MTQTEIHLVRRHSGLYQEQARTQVVCAMSDKAAAEALAVKLERLTEQAPAISDRMYDHLHAWAAPFPGADEGASQADQAAWRAEYERERAAWFDAQGIDDPDLREVVTQYSEGELYYFDVITVPLRTV